MRRAPSPVRSARPVRRWAAGLLLLLASCGDPPPPAGPPVVDRPVAAKPNPLLGELTAEVVERPAPDEARVVARFVPAVGASACFVDLVLPEGATLERGLGRTDAPGPEAQLEWTVRFARDRTLDLVLRACGESAGGPQALEVSLRLVNAPGTDPPPGR